METILKKLAKMPIKLSMLILLALYNELPDLYIDMLQNITEKIERTVYINNRSGKNEPIRSRNPTPQAQHRETTSTETLKAMLSYLELDPNQANEDPATLDLYLKDNQTTMTKQRYIQPTTISIHIFKIKEGEYREEMNDMKSIASLMAETSIKKKLIETETLDSSWNDMKMFLISINPKLVQLPKLYVSIGNTENEGISAIIDFEAEGNVIKKEYCLKNNII